MSFFIAKVTIWMAGLWLVIGLASAGPVEDIDAAYAREDFQLAHQLVKRMAEEGNVQAQFVLGHMLKSGIGVPENKTEAVRWYRQAAKLGHSGAQDKLGLAYRYGEGVEQDERQALMWLQKASNQGNSDASFHLSLMYEHGEGVDKNLATAFKLTQKAIEQGGKFRDVLASMYSTGKGVRKNPDAAIRLLREACVDHKPAKPTSSKGPSLPPNIELWELIAPAPLAPVSHEHLGDGCGYSKAEAEWQVAIYFLETEVLESIKWFRKAAEHGNVWAMSWLARIYEDGKGVKQDKAEAAKWLRKAAEHGDAIAQSLLGVKYRKGEGVRQDAAEAVKWFRKAAEHGDAIAQYFLGGMYRKGEGVSQDATEAAKWYRKAADQGDAAAQYFLGDMYDKGEGVRKDAAEAMKWYQMVLANPDSDEEIKQAAQDGLAILPAASPQRKTPVYADRELPSLSFDRGSTQTISQGDLLIQGSATDPSGIAEVTVDGKAIEFSANGAFSLKRFFPLGETVLEIAATDIHGNRATQKLTVIRQAAATQIAADEPALTPPPAKTRPNPNALALIVGVEDYRNAPQARWAAQDAAMFYDFAQRSLGIPAGNIKLLTGEQANRSGMLVALKTWLAPMVTPGKSQVYVYFAGHGLAASEGDKAYLLPQDGDPSLLEDTALDRQRLFDEIAKVKPLSTTVFLDTCYSGGARGGDGTLVANARPVMIKSKAATLPPGFMQFSAASGDQLAHSHPSQQHGLFSYYLMRGLSGEADANRDNKLTAGELQDYVQSKVKRMALTQGRPQEPELIGDRERVIANWGR